MKPFLALAALALCATAAQADSSQPTYTITLDVLAESSPAPLPTFGVGTLNTSSEQYGDGDILEFDVSMDSGIAPVLVAIPDFGLADTGLIYWCEGCNQGSVEPLYAGTLNMYFPTNGPSGEPSGYEIDYAFPQTPNYFIYGTMTFTDPPANAPEPSALLLLPIGLLGFAALKLRTA